MDADKDEIAEEIAHHTEMLRVLRRRLRERELQEVKFDINVPPEITSDVQDIKSEYSGTMRNWCGCEPSRLKTMKRWRRQNTACYCVMLGIRHRDGPLLVMLRG